MASSDKDGLAGDFWVLMTSRSLFLTVNRNLFSRLIETRTTDERENLRSFPEIASLESLVHRFLCPVSTRTAWQETTMTHLNEEGQRLNFHETVATSVWGLGNCSLSILEATIHDQFPSYRVILLTWTLRQFFCRPENFAMGSTPLEHVWVALAMIGALKLPKYDRERPDSFWQNPSRWLTLHPLSVLSRLSVLQIGQAV